MIYEWLDIIDSISQIGFCVSVKTGPMLNFNKLHLSFDILAISSQDMFVNCLK